MEIDTAHKPRNPPQSSYTWQENGRTPKLRASCDHCAVAKVRCDQDRPSCQRCINLNNVCNYSASRRMGKPPVSRGGRNKANATTHTKNHSRGDVCCGNNSSEEVDGQKNNIQQPRDITLAAFDHDLDHAASQPWSDVNFMTDLAGSTDFTGDPDVSALNFAQLQSTQMRSSLPNTDQMGLFSSFLNNVDPTLDSFRPTTAQTDPQRRFSDHRKPLPTIPHQTITHQSTSCVELASSTIQSLSLPSSMCNSSPDPIPLHTVEEILATSRSAISAFNTILQCSCAQSSSFALTLALILSKILDCCSAICRSLPLATSNGNGKKTPLSRSFLTPSLSTSSLTTLSPMGSSSSTNSTPGGPHNIVLDTPIAMGDYQIEPDDQYTFILQLVLNEIRKVGKLVDSFAVHYSTAEWNNRNYVSAISKAVDGRADSGKDTVHESLEHFLRRQVSRARSEVDSVLTRGEEWTYS